MFSPITSARILFKHQHHHTKFSTIPDNVYINIFTSKAIFKQLCRHRKNQPMVVKCVNFQVPKLVTSTRTTKLDRFPLPHLDMSIVHSLDSLADGSTEEFFTLSIVELKKMPSLIFGHVKSYLNSPKKGMHKAKPSLNMAPLHRSV
jgi:hypothetical protein